MAYRFKLKNEKARQYALLSFVVGLIQLVIFIFLLVAANNRFTMVIAGAGILVISVVFFLRKKNTVNQSLLLNPYHFMYLYFIITWILCGYFWLSPVLLLLGILNALSVKAPVVLITEKDIEYPSLPKKIFSWQQLNNVVLKDGVLTIDFKNDKLLQPELDPAERVDEAAFNQWVQYILVR